MILYHFTSRYHLTGIIDAGQINTTESNISMTEAHAGPDVVWLYDTADVEPSEMMRTWLVTPDGSLGDEVDKTEIGITVDVDDAEPWEEWAKAHGSNRATRRNLIRAGDGLHKHWWVVERPILVAECGSMRASDEVIEALIDLGIETPA